VEWPAETGDLDRLRHLLLSSPRRMSYEAVDYCIETALASST
jgi:hypothetical protein